MLLVMIVSTDEAAGADAKGAVALAPQIAAPVDACVVDVMERPLKDAAKPALTTRAVKCTVSAFGLSTVWIKVKRAKA